MIEKVIYKDGDIEIDNSELLRGSADMSDETGEQKRHGDYLGGWKGEEENKRKKNIKKTGRH